MQPIKKPHLGENRGKDIMKKIVSRSIIASRIARKARLNGGCLEFHGGSYSDGFLVQTKDGNKFHIVTVSVDEKASEQDKGKLEIQIWSEITDSLYVTEEDVTIESLQNILNVIISWEGHWERNGLKHKNKDYLLKETIVLLSSDLFDKIYNHSDGWGDTAETIIKLAGEFEKELNWQDDDTRDYLEELEKFETRVIAERFS